MSEVRLDVLGRGEELTEVGLPAPTDSRSVNRSALGEFGVGTWCGYSPRRMLLGDGAGTFGGGQVPAQGGCPQ
ncbi:hypothetical protein [Streptomyces sp. TP-A0874]|uniref:hypothetical protein n=1 Tax=Streptomyces sp. TP-A0874 TaxID=549819 RepID=UPI001112F102|nr:hypothetical protein [Streptomyces sp. TP-A0874]